MKLNKKLTVAMLALVVGIASFIPSTFSWYDHDDTLTGEKMTYYRENLPVSSGENNKIVMTTKQYRMNGKKVYYDDKGNKEYAKTAYDGTGTELDPITSGQVAPNTTQYYGTTFMNYNSAPAFVNLYLKDFSNNPNNFIGTTAPSLTHKGLSSTVHLKNRNQVRVYCQFDAANDWKESDAAHYVVYKAKGDDVYHYSQITQSTPTQASNSKTTYYADLPDHATEFFFATDGNKSGFVGSDGEFTSVTNPWFRSNTITNIQPGVCYRLTGASDDTTWYAAHTTIDVPNGISVMTSFDTLTISGGQSAYVTLTGGTNFSGVSVSYSCTGTNLSVNANTGYVTAAAGFSSGTITTTITGGLGDTTTFETQVSNPATLKSVTIAMNVEVPGATPDPDDERKTIPGKTEIVWYIANEQGSSGGSNAVFNAIYYTK